jgi:hypothetical protein
MTTGITIGSQCYGTMTIGHEKCVSPMKNEKDIWIGPQGILHSCSSMKNKKLNSTGSIQTQKKNTQK